jgi:sulfopyruvate decarboxylase subunit alpha
MTEMDTKTRATAILASIKKAGINLVASLPDINCLDLINALERDADIIHVPLCREEEGIGICAGARLVGKKPAIVMQNAGLLNSCNGIVTTGIQLELPILLIVYYAGDIGDRGFARVGTATIPDWRLWACVIIYCVTRKKSNGLLKMPGYWQKILVGLWRCC